MSGAREIRRLRYLQALGIPTLVARRALPGAAPTHRLRLRNPPAAIASGAAEAPAARPDPPAAAPSSAAARQSAAAIRKALQPDPIQAARPQSKTPRRSGNAKEQPRPDAVPTADAAADASAATQRFSIAAMLVADRLWVEELEDALLANEQVQLVAAVARAMVHPAPLAAKPAVTQFSWPLHGNQQLDLGPEEAAASLQGFLQRQLDDTGCVELLCLGEAAAQRLSGLRLPCALRRLPASRAVLANPALKRELWAALRA